MHKATLRWHWHRVALFSAVLVQLTKLAGARDCHGTTFTVRGEGVSLGPIDIDTLGNATKFATNLTPFTVQAHIPPLHPLGVGPTTLTFFIRGGKHSDINIVLQQICYCEYCGLAAELPFPPSAVRNILDLGANNGIAANFLSLIFPNTRILGVEPGLNNYHMLSLNTAHNSRIHTVHGAVWGEPGFITLGGDDWGSRTATLRGSEKSVQEIVSADSITGYMRKYHMPHIDLLKVDVEGSEVSIFQNATVVTFLEHVRCVVAEWHNLLAQAKAHWPVFESIMKAYGFENIPRKRGGELTVWCHNAALLKNIYALQRAGSETALSQAIQAR